MQWFSVVLLVFANIGVTQCVVTKVVINEVNLIDPKYPAKNDYIELRQTFDRGNEMPLRGYKVIGFSCKSNSGTIDTVATLWNFRMNKRGIFTIGGNRVKNADIKLPNEMVKTPSSFSKIKMKSLMSNFLVNDTEIRAIALLYDEVNNVKELALTEKAKVLPVDENVARILKRYMIDLVVLAVKAPCDKCAFIEKLYDDFMGKKYILREIRANAANNDISLNRCTIESNGFLPEAFKLGSPTPGEENDCTGPHYVLEDNILEATDRVNANFSYADDFDTEFENSCPSETQPTCTNSIFRSNDVGNEFGESCSSPTQPTCSSSISQSEYSQTTSRSVAQSLHQLNVSSAANVCTNLMLSPDASENAATIDQANKRKRSISVDTDYSKEYEWLSTKYFR